MKNIKKADSHNSKFFDSKEKMLRVGIATVVVLIIIFVFMLIESTEGNIVIRNNTDLKLEYVKAYFINTEGPINEGINFEAIESNKSVVVPTGRYNLLYTESNYEIRFKFENYDEILVDSGYFNDTFKGDITVGFEKTEDADVIHVKVKAKNGLLPSRMIDCNDDFTVHLSEGYVEE